MLCHLGAWDMAIESRQHDNMAFSILSKTLRFMHKNLVWGAQVDNSQKTEFAKQKCMRTGATFWLAAVNLIFGRKTRQGIDYIGQSKLPN